MIKLARDATGKRSVGSSLSIGTPSDTNSPTAVTGLSSPSKTSNSISLSWNAASDNVGLEGYYIYKNGECITKTNSLGYTCMDLSPNTTYTFRVEARDDAENRSVGNSVCSVTTEVPSNAEGKIFKMGQAEDILEKEPFDEYYKYDSNAQASAGDHANWWLWGAAALGSYLLNFPDAAPQYSHYRDATGTDRNINFEKAYNDDQLYKAFIDNLIIDAQLDSETIRSQTNSNSFSLTTKVKYEIPNGFSENWQKALGAIWTWACVDVSYNNGTYTAAIKVYVKDRYNFNPGGAADIVTGVPDSANGRFAVLGWAKSFLTYGDMTKTVTWNEGLIPDYISLPGYDRMRDNADRASRRTS